MKIPAAPAKQTSNSGHLLQEYFHSRPDIGFRKMLLDVALEVRDPFKPWEPRKPKKGFVAALLILCLAVAWFVYWNLFN